MSSETTGCDYETWSRTNLPVRGLHNYVTDPEFKVLLASVADDDGEMTFDWVFNDIWSKGEYIGDRGDNVTQAFAAWLEDHDKAPIMAHNAPFERAVTHWLFPDFDPFRFEDSAVDARCLGAESKLIVASRQLTNSHKLEEGNDLVMLFCVPNEQYPDGPTPALIEQHGHMDKWMKFIEYCEMDARGSRDIRLTAQRILDLYDPLLIVREAYNEQATWEQNQAGWHIDRDLILKMKQRAWANGIIAKRLFLTETGDEINFNSPVQLKKYCEERGFKVGSLDKYHLPVALDRVRKQIAEIITAETDSAVIPMRLDGEENWVWDNESIEKLSPSLQRQVNRLREVQVLLETKQELGGSSLSKLPKILDLVSDDDDILRDQYMHCGAGQTFRTSGRGVQMQNLGKLKMMKDEDGHEYVKDITTVYDLQETWSNGDMAGQLRQVFTSRHEDGALIVGDFSAVESRGLAYLAGEEWKLDAYREGKDVYNVLASKYFGIEYDDVRPDQRPRGKYTELSCGYQASAVALQDFMFRLGFSVSVEQALEDVMAWRAANQNIVNLWYTLDDLLKDSVRGGVQLSRRVGHGMVARSTPFELASMSAQHPGSVSLCLQLLLPDGTPYVTRFVHGCYFRGDSLCYYKPAERLSGQLWKATYTHPKTKRETYYSIYGGKLAGIFTQSLCREMFFESMTELRRVFMRHNIKNALIMGQFHDELNVDWWPGEHSKESIKELIRRAMSQTRLKDFPLVVDVKSSYRYVK